MSTPTQKKILSVSLAAKIHQVAHCGSETCYLYSHSGGSATRPKLRLTKTNQGLRCVKGLWNLWKQICRWKCHPENSLCLCLCGQSMYAFLRCRCNPNKEICWNGNSAHIALMGMYFTTMRKTEAFSQTSPDVTCIMRIILTAHKKFLARTFSGVQFRALE